MKQSQFYENIYPFEPLFPDLNETEVTQMLADCDYIFEANKIASADFPDEPFAKINLADAFAFYQMGYNAAKERIEKCLKAKDI